MSDNGKPMTDQEHHAFLEKWDQENLARMTPFERHLYYNGLFDDVIRPEITAEDVILEPTDLCIDVCCEECIGYWKSDGRALRAEEGDQAFLIGPFSLIYEGNGDTLRFIVEPDVCDRKVAFSAL